MHATLLKLCLSQFSGLVSPFVQEWPLLLAVPLEHHPLILKVSLEMYMYICFESGAKGPLPLPCLPQASPLVHECMGNGVHCFICHFTSTSRRIAFVKVHCSSMLHMASMVGISWKPSDGLAKQVPQHQARQYYVFYVIYYVAQNCNFCYCLASLLRCL